MSSLLDLINARKASLNRVKTLKPPVGRSRYRILPSWRVGSDDPTFWMDYGQHFVKDATGQIKAVYVCEDKTFGRPCPVCDAINHGVTYAPDDLSIKRLTDAKANGRVLLNVLHLDGPTPNQVQILEIAPSVFNGQKGVGGILSLFQDWPDLVDLVKGSDIVIEKSGAGMDTRYGVSAVPASTKLDPAIMSQVHDLDKFVASESEESKRKALASVSAITGVLPAAVTPPRLSASTVGSYGSPPPGAAIAPSAASYSMDDDDELRALEQKARSSDARVEDAKPAMSAAPVADNDLEAMLKDLG